MQIAQTPAATPSPALVRALRHVLRPLVRLMLAHGITYTYVCELLKALFVEIADKEFRIDQSPPTDSRVSLVSGVHRKEVSRLRQAMAEHMDTAPTVVSLGAQLVAVWLSSPQFLDDNARPKALARFASEGGEASFEALVAGVNSDIRPRVVLDEWLRLGVVRFDEQKRVCLNVDAFVPTEGFDEKAFFFGHHLHDHAAAAASNLTGISKPFMERGVHYNALSAESIALLAQQSEQAGMAALLALNKSAMKLEQDDAHKAGPYQRMTFGVYFYTEPMAPAEAP